MRFNRILRTTVSTAAVGIGLIAAGGAAQAQDGQVTTVDEIIVTAQLREQSLQEVPVVVTTISEELLEAAGVADIKDLQILTPGLQVTSTTTEASTTARIRGVGTVGDNPGLESSVGIVIDGVYRSRNSVSFGDLGELQRIEVLKGPQGTLFGKNTSAGVINIITEAPSFTPGFEAELTAGNYGAFGIAGSATGPLSEQLAGRIYVAARQRDGFYDIDVGDGPRTETDDANQDYWTARGQLLWLPNDATSIRFIADYTKRDEYCCVGVQVRSGPTAALVDLLTTNGTGVAPATPGFGRNAFTRQAYANRSTEQEIEDYGVSGEVNVDIDAWNARFTSITSFREWSTVNGQDTDFSGADIAYRVADGDFGTDLDNFTQEFRLAGTSDRADWLLGMYISKENIQRRDTFYLGSDYAPILSLQLTSALNAAVPAFAVSPNSLPCFSAAGQTALGLQTCLATGGAAGPRGPNIVAGQSLRDVYDQSSDTFALFTNNTFRLTDTWDVTVGLRYTWDEKAIRGLQQNLGAAQLACAGTLGNAALINGTFGAVTGGSIIGRMCLPWTNPLYNNRRVAEDAEANEATGTFKTSWRPIEGLMLYASYARGYKSFGFNMDRVQAGVTPTASLLFPSEIVEAYEAGFKSTLFNGSLLFNATYFDQSFEDFQLNTFLGTAFVVESIPELTSKGVDMDFVWFSPFEGLTMQGGLTYTDARYGDFTAADLAIPGNFGQLSLLPGARPSFAPEWSGSLAMNYERSLGSGLRGGFNLSAKYVSEYNTGSDLLPFKSQDAFTTVNGRITIGAENDRWAIDLWAQNLLDEEYTQVAYNAFLQGSAFQSTPNAQGQYYVPAGDTLTYDAFLGAPRTYGVTLRVSY
ncbi:TonB-dependent receptor [Brevundimonas balnearis]|uniref:TonB-dependent receptor n=1 Tax=Brevundimonas balnearis TaxID=1572858 RepID=A0ABV6R063_9CAUL